MRAIGLLLVVMLAVAGVVAVGYSTINGGADAKPEPWSQFLSDVQAGQVESVTQDGEVVTYRRGGVDVTAIVPSVLTDVNAEVAAAAVAGRVVPPTFSKNVAPDMSWLELIAVGILPIALIVLTLLVIWFGTRRRGPRDPLRILDEAWSAGLLTPEEYATKRQRLLGNP